MSSAARSNPGSDRSTAHHTPDALHQRVFLASAFRLTQNRIGNAHLPMSWSSAATSRFCNCSSESRALARRACHSARRVLCTPYSVLQINSWLNEQITEYAGRKSALQLFDSQCSAAHWTMVFTVVASYLRVRLGGSCKTNKQCPGSSKWNSNYLPRRKRLIESRRRDSGLA